MSKVTVSITKQNIYTIAEGISISISQHNGGTPTYEQLWASADEARKLDMYYREAISDLERHLTEWLTQSSGQFNLTEDSGDYILNLTLSAYWPTNMEGLLANKVQDYLVHAVTAGWLNDFEGLSIKQDYQALATNDISDIRAIIYLRGFNFQEADRATDTTDKEEPASLTPSDRAADSTQKDEPASLTPTDRTADGTQKDEPASLTPTDRTADSTQKDEPASLTPSDRAADDSVKDGSPVLAPTDRAADTDKEGPLFRPEVNDRQKDNASRSNHQTCTLPSEHFRHRDNDIVEHVSDHTDWSGAGIVFHDRPGCHRTMTTPPHYITQAGYGINQQSCRVNGGRGYTPSPLDNAERPRDTQNCPLCPPQPPVPPMPAPDGSPVGPGSVPYGSPSDKDPRIPDFPSHPNYPLIEANGLGWTDEDLYDEEGSEHYINGQCTK